MFGMQVPAFMLKQFYQAGSLRNGEHGLQFALTNPLLAATIVEILEVAIAGEAQSLADIAFTQDGVQREPRTVSPAAPVRFNKDAVVTVTIVGMSLEAGKHAVSFKVRTNEFGTIQVDVEDTLAAA